MLPTNPCVSRVPQNPNSQRSVAPGLQRVIYSMVNESLILRKRQLRAASGSFCRPKTSELFLKQDKVKEIMFDLLWHSYNYLDPGEEPFLWLGCCHLIFHLKDVKAISVLAVRARCGKILDFQLKLFCSSHCSSAAFTSNFTLFYWFMMTYVIDHRMYFVVFQQLLW